MVDVYEKVVKKKHCVSCGMCEIVCPQKCISTHKMEGQFIPMVEMLKCTQCGICSSICSQCEETFIEHSPVKYCCNAYSKDETMHKNGTSGGVVGTTIQMLLMKGVYDAAFVVESFSYNDEVFETMLNKSASVERGQKSKYVPVNHSKSVEYILKNRNARVILIGTPCAIKSYRNIIEKFKLTKENYLLLGLFCDKVENQNIFLYFQNLVKGKNIKELYFRTKEESPWPGNVKLCYEDGTTKYLPAIVRMRVKEYFQLESCMNCKNKLNEGADISFGDSYDNRDFAEKVNGSTTLIVRTQQGMEAWKYIEQAVYYQDASYEKIYSAQKMEYRGMRTLKEKKRLLKKIDIGREYPASKLKLLCELRLKQLFAMWLRVYYRMKS